VAPYFNAYVSSLLPSPNSDDLEGRSDLVSSTSPSIAKKRTSPEDTKGIPIAKKKFAELELSLIHLQQNAEIPETILHVHPTIVNAVEACRVNGSRVTLDVIPSEMLADSSFLNRLQSDVNTWVKEIQKVTKLSRDPSTGSAAQEINFWLSLESGLDKIDKQLKDDAIGMQFYFNATRLVFQILDGNQSMLFFAT
jgi:dynein heavy chain 1